MADIGRLVLTLCFSLTIISCLFIFSLSPNMKNYYDKKLLRNATIIGIITSFLLLLNWTYGFYFLGKLFIFWIDFYLICYMYNYEFEERKTRLLILAIVMIIFNPIFPVPFQKIIRQVFDILSGTILIIIYVILNKDQRIIFEIKEFLKKKKIFS